MCASSSTHTAPSGFPRGSPDTGIALLTEDQQRALEVGLRRIETQLGWIEELLGWRYEGVLVAFVDDLGESGRRRLREQIREARGLLQDLQRSLGLRPEQIRKSSWIVGHLAHLWVWAEESQSRYLRGYGVVGPGLPERLDPLARRLGELLLAMQRVAREGSAEGPVRGRPKDADA